MYRVGFCCENQKYVASKTKMELALQHQHWIECVCEKIVLSGHHIVTLQNQTLANLIDVEVSDSAQGQAGLLSDSR